KLGQKVEHLIRSDNLRRQIAAADIVIVVGMPDEALPIFAHVIEKWPERSNLWVVMGQTELSKTESANPALALTYLKKGIDSGYKTAQAYALLGMAYSQVGEKEKARTSLGQA